jgi:Fe-S cluster biogenesis protein NfuA
MPDDVQLQSKLARVEELIHEAEQLPDENLRSKVQELVQHLMDFHGAGLARMVGRVRELGEPGQAVLHDWTRDEVTSSLLLLYGLHPVDIECRVRDALIAIRSELRAQGVEVELVGVEEGVVRLHMKDKTGGAPSAGIAVRRKIAKAVYDAAPDAVSIKSDGDAPRHAADNIKFISMDQLKAVSCSTTAGHP